MAQLALRTHGGLAGSGSDERHHVRVARAVVPAARDARDRLRLPFLPGEPAGWIGTAAIGLAFLAALGALIKMQGHAPADRELNSSLWSYAVTVGIDAHVSILVDPLSVYMILIVSGISTMIHLYSVSYLEQDRGFARYFSYLNFFVFSMLLLVLAGNFLLLIVGWAFVGAASYLLISFWYRRTTATRAGIKAFVINVVGDVGLVLGTYFIFKHTGTLEFSKVFAAAPHVFHSGEADITAGCLLLLVGAAAKSAQIPLHTWLPDAMEGPTPVSALIHAATMVTAGVYLIARMHTLFELAPAAQDTGAVIGALTLLIAGTIALVQTDIKRVIAYSTMSQIGYMIMGVSVGAYAAGMFHLMTHAFFKALLFMGAGLDHRRDGRRAVAREDGRLSQGAAVHLRLLRDRRARPVGHPPFSGFFSKDEILLVTAERGGWHWALYAIGYIGAFLTAIYTFRMIFRAFYGDPVAEARELEGGHLHHAEVPTNPATGEVEDTDVGFPGPHHTIAERALPMRVAMSVLAVGAVGAGLVQVPGVDDVIVNFLRPTLRELAAVRTAHPRRPADLRPVPRHRARPERHRDRVPHLGARSPRSPWSRASGFGAVYELLWHKWYFDEAIDLLIVRPAAAAGRFAQRHLRARVRRGHARRRRHRGRPRRLRRGARRAERLPALLRRAARARRRRARPLLPAAVPDAHALRSSSGSPSPAAWLGAVLGRLRKPSAFAGGLVALAGSVGRRWRWRSATSPTTRRRRTQHVTDVVWIAALGIHYKLGVSGLNVLLVGLTTLLFAPPVAGARNRAQDKAHWRPRAPAALLLPLHARRVGRARRVPRAGPRAVRGVLRPDADPVLLPDRGVGRRARTG